MKSPSSPFRCIHLFYLTLVPLIYLDSCSGTSSTKSSEEVVKATRDCITGSFGLKTDFKIGESTGMQVDCYATWTDYTLQMINKKPQWTSGRYGSNFYDNNAIDSNCYECIVGLGHFSPGAAQNWKESDGHFYLHLCRVVKDGGVIHAKWVTLQRCD